MSEQARSRLLDLCSTKDAGKGSGIGLAAIFGNVQQSGGFVQVESQLEHGSAFSIYLPRLPEESWSEPSTRPPAGCFSQIRTGPGGGLSPSKIRE